MKFLDLLLMSASSLWKRKVRTILTILGVVVGTASIVVMISLGLGLNRATMEEIEKNGGLTTINVYEKGSIYSEDYYNEESGEENGQTLHLNDEAVESLSTLEHVKAVYPVIEMDCLAFCKSFQSYLSIRGMSQEAFAQLNKELADGQVFSDSEFDLVMGNAAIAGFYNEKTGDGYWYNGTAADIDFMKDPIFLIFDQDAYYNYKWGGTDENGQAAKKPKKYVTKGAGVLAGEMDDYSLYSDGAFCDIELLKNILKKEFKNKAIPGQPTTASGKPYKEIFYTKIVVEVDNMNNLKELQKTIREMGFSPSSNQEWVESQQKQLGYIQMVLGGIGAVSLLVAAIGIANTMMMSIYERTKEIGVMKVLGCDLRNIQGMFLFEAAYIGFIGGVVGLVLSFGISALINFFLGSDALGMGGSSGLSYIPFWLVLLAIGFSTLVGMLSGFFPSLRAMKLSPLAAIRNE